MSITRRQFLGGASSLLALGALGQRPWPAHAMTTRASARRHVVLIALRGGFDSVLSLDPKDPAVVGDSIELGYRADERIAGARRLFGPLAGGLERHDAKLCLMHGVRSDTTSHTDGLEMLARGRIRARKAKVAQLIGNALPGDAPLPLLKLDSPDGEPLVAEGERPAWAELRQREHQRQARQLAAGEMLARGLAGSNQLSRYLHEARVDATALDTHFQGDLAVPLRLAFQAIRGNWARCIEVGSRALWFDSHSDNLRFQRMRQPATWADISALIDLLGSTRDGQGSLLERTTIAVYSEFGRFPRLNGEHGKDHFPENSWLLAGAGIRGGATIGATDAQGKSVPCSYSSGEAGGPGARHIFLDNAFATVCHLAGAKPEACGYEKDAVVQAALAS